MKVIGENRRQPEVTARFADLDKLLETIIPAFLNPVPSKATLRSWFKQARVQRFKANPSAKRGGGPVGYYVPDVEKFFKARIRTH